MYNIGEKILIFDFGSQYTQLIARRIRELCVYSEIVPWDADLDLCLDETVKGIVLSGGPSSIYEKEAPFVSKKLFEKSIPVLGICYGMQLMAHLLGGEVIKGGKGEYGRAELKILSDSLLWKGIAEKSFIVWMSHQDKVVAVPKGFKVIAESTNSEIAAISDEKRRLFGVQFHPEVSHTQNGMQILSNFLDVCGCKRTWKLSSWLDNTISEIRAKVGDKRVICGISGGVDSTVAAVLTSKAIGDNLVCIFVNNGLLRLNEPQTVMDAYKKLNLNVKYVDASDRFLKALRGVQDPEQKRKIIGEIFVRVFEEEAQKVEGAEFLLQGTLYPDVIESGKRSKSADVIKTHHNVGGIPDDLGLKLLEPLKDLFKDEVRRIGKLLGIPDFIVKRHPFPGPGLAVRCIGEITTDRLNILRHADAILLEEIEKNNWYEKLWQAFCVLLPVKTVGVMGDRRTYENAVVLRCVCSEDGMTADWAHLPHDLLDKIATRICNEVKGINRVVYDITSKPPGTVEWE